VAWELLADPLLKDAITLSHYLMRSLIFSTLDYLKDKAPNNALPTSYTAVLSKLVPMKSAGAIAFLSIVFKKIPALG